MFISILFSVVVSLLFYVLLTFDTKRDVYIYEYKISKELSKNAFFDCIEFLNFSKYVLIAIIVFGFILLAIFSSIEYFLFMFLPRFVLFTIVLLFLNIFITLKFKKKNNKNVVLIRRFNNIEHKMELIREVKLIIMDRISNLDKILFEKRDEQHETLSEAYKMFEEIYAELYNSLSMIQMNHKISELGDIIIPESGLCLLQNHMDKIKAQKSLSEIYSDLDDLMKKYDVKK